MCLAIPGKIVEIVNAEDHLAKVDFSGVRRNINVMLIADEGIGVGDWVLVHVGFALSRIDEDQAARTLELLEELGSEYELEREQIEDSSID